MSSLTTRDIVMSATDYAAITNPNTPKNIAGIARAQKTIARISNARILTDDSPKSPKLSLRKRLEVINGTVR